MRLGEIIKEYRKRTHKTLKDFAYDSNISVSYLSMLENNSIPSTTGKEILPSIDIIKKCAKGMNIEFDDLFKMLDSESEVSLTDNMLIKNIQVPIPLYSEVSCGYGLFVDDFVEDYITIPDRYVKRGREYFAMTAHGDSMINKGIIEGDILVFEKTQHLENGQMGCFCVDHNMAVCKIFRNVNGTIFLESANDKYDPIIVDVTSECFMIIGKYVCRFTV